jgi:hypothetical protein
MAAPPSRSGRGTGPAGRRPGRPGLRGRRRRPARGGGRLGSSRARRRAERSARAQSLACWARAKMLFCRRISTARSEIGLISSPAGGDVGHQAGAQGPARQLGRQDDAALAERVQRQRPFLGLDAQQEVAGEVDAMQVQAAPGGRRANRRRPAPRAGPCGARRWRSRRRCRGGRRSSGRRSGAGRQPGSRPRPPRATRPSARSVRRSIERPWPGRWHGAQCRDLGSSCTAQARAASNSGKALSERFAGVGQDFFGLVAGH